MRSIRLSNAAFHRSVGQVEGGLEFLQSLGFAAIQETQMLVLDLNPREKSKLEDGLKLLNVEADDLNISPDTRPVVRLKKVDPSFDVFKTQITRVQVRAVVCLRGLNALCLSQSRTLLFRCNRAAQVQPKFLLMRLNLSKTSWLAMRNPLETRLFLSRGDAGVGEMTQSPFVRKMSAATRNC
jgi:hypothetical protein